MSESADVGRFCKASAKVFPNPKKVFFLHEKKVQMFLHEKIVSGKKVTIRL